MSVGNLQGGVKTKAELYKVLGQGDTSKLKAQPVTLDHVHDIAYAGGISVDRKTAYVDQTLYDEIMSGRVRVRGLSPHQVLERIVDHEHTEKVVEDGDNAVDSYLPAHEFATTNEHEGVEIILGDSGPQRYEDDLRDALKRCLKRFLAKGRNADPPRDLWCGPYLDAPDADDKRILAIMRAKGVADASKLSKIVVHYGIGANECRDCRHFGKHGGILRECELVSGLVRDDRHCDRWVAAK